MNDRKIRSFPIVWIAIPFYVVGILGHAFDSTRPFFLSLTAIFLYSSAVFFLVLERARPSVIRFLLWFGPVFAATLGLESLGVQTGLVFGTYSYTPLLGISLGGVPIVIGLNWVLVVWGASQFVQQLFPQGTPLIKALLAALGCVAFDFLLEPVAIHLGYWTWVNDSPPLQNYLSWGAIAFASSWYGYKVYFSGQNKTISWNFAFQTAFFLAIDLLLFFRLIPLKVQG